MSELSLGIDLPKPNEVMREVGGSSYELVNGIRLLQTMSAAWKGNYDQEGNKTLDQVSALSLLGISPRDDIEGMLAAQMVACHNATMECYRRAMLPEQAFEARQGNLSFANKLSRTYAMQIDALQKYRGKGQQKVTVEHVHVHSGGQAIVGHIDHALGGRETPKH
jgi:hypothetical protein